MSEISRADAVLDLAHRRLRVGGISVGNAGLAGRLEVRVSGTLRPPDDAKWSAYVPKDAKPLGDTETYEAIRHSVMYSFGSFIHALVEMGCVVVEESITLNALGLYAEVMVKVWPPASPEAGAA